ncbi:MAG: D-alanine--D-alanine ligase [Alphaproteobacteria bacterium]|nr:MAG: D-alanine--D-alanine ligase [Alphaproteobacteria bacterium]
MTERVKVAVIFGGPSSEHDVSVLTGLQVLEALDPAKYEGFPVYVGLDGQWWTGDALRNRKNYIPDAALKRELVRVSLNIGASREGGRWLLREVGGGLLKRGKTFAFDVVIPALHGTWGEDGTLQGVLASEGIPVVGGNVGAMGLTINKMWTTGAAASAGLPVPATMYVARGQDVAAKLDAWKGTYPVFVKPNTLGSSIGARVAKDRADAEQAVAEVFRLDTAALVQRCIGNLVEYNVAVRRNRKGQLETSAIERPLRAGESLDFKDKYLSGGGLDKLGNKLGAAREGMASATRVLNPPELDAARDGQIRNWAKALFEAVDLAGAPRLDFLCDETTGEIWFNEINPLPGSFGYFLWEGAQESVGFSELLDDMIGEARSRMRSHARVVDPVANGGAIFRKRGV